MIKQQGNTLREPLQKKAGTVSSPRSHSTPRSNHNHVVTIVNPIATLSHRDKLFLTEALKKAPSKQAITPPPFKFNPQDYIFDQEDDETNIIVDGNVIKAASTIYVYFSFSHHLLKPLAIEKLVERVTTELYAGIPP